MFLFFLLNKLTGGLSQSCLKSNKAHFGAMS